MATDDPSPPTPPPGRDPQRNISQQFALAMELPFLLVLSVVIGGGLGWLLDRWLKTSPWLLVFFGALGFYAGIREMLRRLDTRAKGGKKA